jgi:hypothetical protein
MRSINLLVDHAIDETALNLCLYWFGVQYTSHFRRLPWLKFDSTLSSQEGATAASMGCKKDKVLSEKLHVTEAVLAAREHFVDTLDNIVGDHT